MARHKDADAGRATAPGAAGGADEPRGALARAGFVLAAAFIGFVAVIGTVVVLTSDTAGGGAGEAARPAPAAEGEEAAESGGAGRSGGGACPERAAGPARDAEVPLSAPEGVTWELYHAAALPASPDAGPAVVEGDVARCYARTPLGALLASSQISVRYLAAEDWLVVAEAQTVGSGRAAYIAARTDAQGTAGEADAAGEGGAVHGQIAGFRFVTYHDATAVIETVWRFPDGRMQAALTTVLWRDGDWRLEFPAAPAPPTPVDSLSGYVPWSGV